MAGAIAVATRATREIVAKTQQCGKICTVLAIILLTTGAVTWLYHPTLYRDTVSSEAPETREIHLKVWGLGARVSQLKVE